MKRREGIGGVTIAVVGLVLALSVGIAATAHGGVFNEGLTESSQDLALAATAPEPGAAVAPEEWGEALVPAAGVRPDASSRTTTVSVQTAVSHAAASPTGKSGTCIVKTRIVTSAPAAPAASPQPQIDGARQLATRGGHALQASAA